MQLLKELEINGVSVDVLGIDRTSSNLILRITNGSEKIHTSIENSKYISVSKGVLQMGYDVEPYEMKYEGMAIPSNSFIDVKIPFGICKYENRDRFEIHLKNIAEITTEYQNGMWYVLEYENNQKICEYIESRCFRYEAIEEKFGISIQNISVKIENDKCIKPYCEIISTSNESPFFDFSIEVGVYDKSNKIIGFTSIHKYKSDFLGFEIFSFNGIEVDKPLKEIGKVVFYPIKL